MSASDSFYPDGSRDSTITSGVSGTRRADNGGPVVIGYIRQHLLMTQTEVRYAKEQLAYFADEQSLMLGEVYVEEIETWPAAFEALIEDAMRDDVGGVLLPSMLHFAVLGTSAKVKKHFEYLTGARVYAVAELVSYRTGVAAS